jgi:hypothetical protein
LSYVEKEIIERIKDEVVKSLAVQIVDEAKRNLKRWNMDTSGKLRESFEIREIEDGFEIVNTAPYADTVEYGRSPGTMPPVSAIQRWVEVKLGLQGKESKRVAWAVATKIQELGIGPKPYLRNAVYRVLGEVR